MNNFLFRACTGFDLGVNSARWSEERRVMGEEQSGKRSSRLKVAQLIVRTVLLCVCLTALVLGLLGSGNLYPLVSSGSAEQLFVSLLEAATWLFATLTLGTWLVVELVLIRAWLRARSMAVRSKSARN